MAESISFTDSLEEDDWGLIIGSDGSLKGLYIPEGHEDAEVPDTIVLICEKFFGIDPTEKVTLH